MAPGIKIASLVSVLVNTGKEVTPYVSKTESGIFTQFYGVHGTQIGQFRTARDKLNVKEFSNLKVDAVFLESGKMSDGPYAEGIIGEIPIEQANGMMQQDLWYHDIIPELIRKRVPILLGDMPATAMASMESYALSVLPLAAAVGGTLGFSKKENMSRREFFKRAGSGIAAVWGYQYLIGELTNLSLPLMGQLPWVSKLREAASFAEFSHPEHILLNFRNALIAEKLLYYAEQKRKETGKNVNVAVIIGENHALLSEYLKKGRGFCKDYLDIYPEGFTRHIFGTNLDEYYYPLYELTAQESTFRIRSMHDPELKNRFLSGERERRSSAGLERS